MKKRSKKLAKQSNLEEKVDFMIDFLQSEVPSKDDIGHLSERLTKVENNTNNVINAIDGLAKQVKDYHQEMIFLVHRVERMETWIRKASIKLSIPYEV